MNRHIQTMVSQEDFVSLKTICLEEKTPLKELLHRIVVQFLENRKLIKED